MLGTNKLSFHACYISVHHIGILLPGTELLDSQVRMDFSIGSTHAVLIKFTTEFSFESLTAELNKCDVFATVTVTGLPTNGINLGH